MRRRTFHRQVSPTRRFPWALETKSHRILKECWHNAMLVGWDCGSVVTTSTQSQFSLPSTRIMDAQDLAARLAGPQDFEGEDKALKW